MLQKMQGRVNIWVLLMAGLLKQRHWLSTFKYFCCFAIIKVREIKFPLFAYFWSLKNIL